MKSLFGSLRSRRRKQDDQGEQDLAGGNVNNNTTATTSNSSGSSIMLVSPLLEREYFDKFTANDSDVDDKEQLSVETIRKDDLAKTLFTRLLPDQNLAQFRRFIREAGLNDVKYWENIRPQLPSKAGVPGAIVPANEEEEARECCPLAERSLASLLSDIKPEQLMRLLKQIGATSPRGFLNDIVDEAIESLSATFAEYGGVRQCGDLRGLGSELHQSALAWVNNLHRQVLAMLVWSLNVARHSVVDNEESMAVYQKLSREIPVFLADILTQYQATVDQALVRLGVVSSKQCFDGSSSLNEVYKEKLISEIIAATSRFEINLEAEINEKLAALDQCSVSRRDRILSSFDDTGDGNVAAGRQAVKLAVKQACGGELREWAVNWLKVQKDSFLTREVYGMNADEIRSRLQESLDALLLGFNAVLESRVADPLVPIAELIEKLDQP